MKKALKTSTSLLSMAAVMALAAPTFAHAAADEKAPVHEQMQRDLEEAGDKLGSVVGGAVQDVENAANRAAHDLETRGNVGLEPVTTVEVYETLSIDAMSAAELRAAPLFNQSGEQIGQVRDLIIDPAYNEKMLLVDKGGLTTFIDDDFLIHFDAATIARTQEGALRVIAETEGDRLADGTPFDEDRYGDGVISIDDMTDSEVTLTGAADDNNTADIVDILVEADGEPTYVILARGDRLFGDDRKLVALDFSDLMIEQGDGGLFINMTIEDFNAAPNFVYR